MVDVLSAHEWAERYKHAWVNADADAVVSLFTASGEYRDNIFEEPHIGADAIKRYWLTVTAAQSDVRVRMGRPVVDGRRVVIEFWTTMRVADDPVTLPGSLILTIDESGLCTHLREYWHFQPGTFDPPEGWGT